VSRRYCFDTNIIVEILTNNAAGQRTAAEWQGIKDLTRDVDSGRATLVLPTIIFAELLPSHHGDIELLERLFQRKSIELWDLTVRIARRAAELRDQAKAITTKALRTPDAIFLATAEISKADELFSLDPDIFKNVGVGVKVSKPHSFVLPLLPEPDRGSEWKL
jgi:predicted nucleic acid-binding protein